MHILNVQIQSPATPNILHRVRQTNHILRGIYHTEHNSHRGHRANIREQHVRKIQNYRRIFAVLEALCRLPRTGPRSLFRLRLRLRPRARRRVIFLADDGG